MTFQGITFQRILRFSARMVRTHAPGVFHRVSANRILRAVYRRIAVTSQVAYVSPPIAVVVDTAGAPVSLASFLKIEMAKWNPGKRIDA